MEAPTHDALVDAIQTAQTDSPQDETRARLREYGLSYDDIAVFVTRQTPVLEDAGPAMLTGILLGIEIGRTTTDPSFGLPVVHPEQMHTDDLRGDRDR